ncbi:MAG: hypothetical protein AB1726_18115 [Planctomycetota bacterium]
MPTIPDPRPLGGAAKLVERLAGLRRVHVAPGSPPVCATVAEEIVARWAPGARLVRARPERDDPAALAIAVGSLPGGRRASGPAWTFFDPGGERAGRGAHLAAAEAHHLFAFVSHLVEVWGDRELRALPRGPQRPAFAVQRPVWDLYFAQAARAVRDMEPATYVRQMARYGFTHLEVNALAAPEGHEEGVPGEVYPRFYTYCPALDQFAASFLTRGLYPPSHLAANRARLRANCELAVRYGLIPAMTCFEPRSVPERLLARYPELRGARVDHPFRSFRPRFNLAVSHPVVRRHYRELLESVMELVPALGQLSIWSNDSGAGFEFTRSLYAGANGSAYLAREWSAPDVLARAAAANVLDFLRLLQETGARTNPAFRVATRLEPFGPERPLVRAGLGRGLDVEAPTLLREGWDTPYRHPRYRDTAVSPFTILCRDFAPAEGREIRRLARRGCRTHVMYAHGPVNDFEPLLGLPAPWLTHEKLAALRRAGAPWLAHHGGVAPPAAVPWNANEEIFRRFQFDPALDVDAAVRAIAREWAGEAHAPLVVRAWRDVEAAIRGCAPNPLYLSWGVWYRILVRPLVPDIELIPARARAYYERHLLATHHNPNRVDLARDVLFTLATPAAARRAVARADRYSLPRIARAVDRLEGEVAALDRGDPARAFLADQRDRARALQCWLTTDRHVSAWIADVDGYLAARDRRARAACRRRLAATIAGEIANARALLHLWRTSRVRFLAISAGAETTFLYGRSFGRHLARKIALMERYGGAAPRIDRDIQWRVAALTGARRGAPARRRRGGG